MGRDPYAKWDKRSRIGYVLAAALLVLLLLACAAVVYLHVVVGPAVQRSYAKVDVETAAALLGEGRPPRGHGAWPPYSGRNFVLSLVADGRVDRRDPRNLTFLFVRDGMPADLDVRAYAEITSDALRIRRFPRLTTLAGRRNADPDASIPTDPAQHPTPIVAWLGLEDRAVVGYSDGEVRILDRGALGLDEDDPLEVGRDAKSPILRLLSDE